MYQKKKKNYTEYEKYFGKNCPLNEKPSGNAINDYY